MIFKKLKLSIIITILAALFLTPYAYALELTSTSAIVIDANSDRCYYEMDADTPLAPASMTKVMTVYLIYEAIDQGKLTKDTMIIADEEDEAASIDPVATNVYLEAGQAYSVDELIGAILVPSACAASAMVGKYISGSEAAFAELMTKTAEDLGLTAYYEDASGLSDNNRITARSMAKLIDIIMTKYPDVLNYTSRYHITFGGKQYKSTNRMLPEGSMPYSGVDGFKTGTTKLAGRCFSATAANEDTRLISVTMHSGHGSSRFDDTKKLLDLGFSEADAHYNNIYATDLKVFINGKEAPTFCYTGSSDYLTVIAEDLSHYGFDITWDNDIKLLSVRRNSEKSMEPIDTQPYKQYTPGEPLLPIFDHELTVTFDYGGKIYTLNNIHSLSGYIAVSADELGEIAKSKHWDAESGSLYLEF